MKQLPRHTEFVKFSRKKRPVHGRLKGEDTRKVQSCCRFDEYKGLYNVNKATTHLDCEVQEIAQVGESEDSFDEDYKLKHGEKLIKKPKKYLGEPSTATELTHDSFISPSTV